jgi:membrane protein DedA with SNARE-associated domain
VVDAVLSLSGWPVYAAVALLAFGEAAAFVGLVLPGETALLVGGALAATGHARLAILLPVAIVAAIAGDTVGYEVGRYAGPALRRSRTGLWIGAERWARAEEFVRRRGGPAVLLGRWVGVLRALVPTLAGMTRMPYRRFLAWNAVGGVTWATTVVLAGYAAGSAWQTAGHALGTAGTVLGALVVATAVVVLIVRRVGRSSAGRRKPADSPAPVGGPPGRSPGPS